ncbi:MAG: nucleotide exchange factor GrpE [Alphaproteobacteria bacterium]|nr:nucleotide exchange factor GrpE [Marinicaulis sp.]NOX95582.1 nucleotide exchange factor GrpE [Alphaproteobacteria bacterium]
MSNQDTPSNTGQKPANDAADDNINLGGEDLAENQPKDVGAANEETLAALNDRFLRMAAELENTRRRAAREKIEAGKYAITNFARDLLDVVDNFERALRSADDENATPSSDAITGLMSGLRMTEEKLLTILKRYGVNRIFPAGEKFDPNLHQAVAQVPGGTIPAGHVVDVAQPGFTIGDRVLRAAIVTVSNGTSDPGAPDEQTDTKV